MKVLVTGANGFVGQNLLVRLREEKIEFTTFVRDDSLIDLEEKIKNCGFIVHLAGVNRPKNEVEFTEGNTDLTIKIAEILDDIQLKIPVIYSSSIQAELDNPYGSSKKLAEDALIKLSEKNGNAVYNYRLPNVFGKWCKPNYNSAVATFCYNTINDLPIQVNDPTSLINLVYIDDVVDATVLSIEKDEANYEVFNVGTGERTDVMTVANSLKNIYNSDTEITISGNYKLGDIKDNFADLEKIQLKLGFSPKINFESGIKRFCEWVNEQEVEDDKYEKSVVEMKEKGLYK